MGIVGRKRSCFRLFERKNEVATEKIAVEFYFVLNGNGIRRVCFGECDGQFGEGERRTVACPEFDFWRFRALFVAELGACVEREAFP